MLPNSQTAPLPGNRATASSCYTHRSIYTQGSMVQEKIQEALESGRRLVDEALERLLPAGSQPPESIHRAMRHSVFAGGKRLRPILCLEAARMVSGTIPDGIEELG